MDLSINEAAPVEGTDRRRSERPRVRKAVTLCWLENGEECRESTHTLTISLFGCALENNGHLRPNTPVRLLHEGKVIEGQVIYNLKDSTKNFIEVGIGFEAEGAEFWQYQF